MSCDHIAELTELRRRLCEQTRGFEPGEPYVYSCGHLKPLEWTWCRECLGALIERNRELESAMRPLAEQVYSAHDVEEARRLLGIPIEPATVEQLSPVNRGQPVLPLLIRDLCSRSEMGRERYGCMLHTHNGRDALTDAYQEALDLVQYLRQALAERENEG